MQWVVSKNKGTPPTDFVGGFQFPEIGAPQQQPVMITTPGVADLQFVPTPQNDYQHSYFPESGFPNEPRQCATSFQTTYTRFYNTSHGNHSRSWKRSGEHNKLQKMPLPQYISPGLSEWAPPPHYQAPRQYTGSPSFYAPVQPPAPEQKPAQSGPRLFHYSKCTGRKKAVCVGINYTGTAMELNGCVNDARNVRNFLMRNWNFKPEDIIVLTDDTQDPRRLPTKANILGAMKWLVKGSKAHDSLFFHYSGHGGQVRDTDGDEADGYDEVIYPLDYGQRGVGIISDDIMNDLLVRPVPNSCRLTALFDSCHSGSVLDLVYLYHSNGRLKRSEVSSRFHTAKSSAGDVISFSGCNDNQTSADVVKNGLAVGAMSHAFMKCLDANPKQSYQQLLKNIREILRKNYTQKPQLSSSHEIDTNLSFVL